LIIKFHFRTEVGARLAITRKNKKAGNAPATAATPVSSRQACAASAAELTWLASFSG